MIDEGLSEAAVRLFLRALYGESSRGNIGRRQYYKALSELERSNIAKVIRSASKPALIIPTAFPSTANQCGEEINKEINKEINDDISFIYSINIVAGPEATEHDTLEPVSPSPTQIQYPQRTQVQGVSFKDTVSPKETPSVSFKDTPLKGVTPKDTPLPQPVSFKDTPPKGVSPEDTEFLDTVELVEIADAIEVNESEGMGPGSSFQRRRKEQVKVLIKAWGEVLPQANMPSDKSFKRWLVDAGNRAHLVYTKMLDVKRYIKDMAGCTEYMNKVMSGVRADLESTKPQRPMSAASSGGAGDDFTPELREETEQEHRERLEQAKRFQEILNQKNRGNK